MSRIMPCFALLLLLCLPFAVWAQNAHRPLPAGDALLPADALAAFTLLGKDAAKVETVPVTGQTFAQALRATTTVKPPETYSSQLSYRTTTSIAQGDVLLATFFVRSVGGGGETGEGQTNFIFEQAAAPNTKSVFYSVHAGPAWKRFDVPFVVHTAYAPGEAQINFHLGFAPQQIEIGGISVTDYGAQVKLEDLPRTHETYAGEELDAPWRKEAAARIEKIRKGNITVQVTDAGGKPISGATVTVRMKRHAFGFGSAVTTDMMLDPSPDGQKYRDIVFTDFSKVVFENDLKWPQWEGNEAHKQRTLQALALLREHGISVRGHNLIWPSKKLLPKSVSELLTDPPALRKRIDDHIKDEVGTFKGQLAEWDVVNEPFKNHDVMDVLGRDVLIHWYQLTHETDTAPLLFLNDYPPLNGSLTDNEHLNNFENNIQYLKDGGAPIGGIGFQCHFGGTPIPPTDLLSGLNRFAKFGLPIEATEFDIDTTDATLQADYTRDVLTALFSHPSVNGIIMWGFWEGRHWRPDAALWRKDWTVKPNGQAWLDLVTKTWWTNAQGKTNVQGVYAARGFLGDYELTITAQGKTKTVKMTLPKAGATVKAALP